MEPDWWEASTRQFSPVAADAKPAGHPPAGIAAHAALVGQPMLIIPALTGHVVGAARSYSRRTVRRGAPTRTRHRFYWARPSSLCLWFAGDRPSMRWTLRDGLPSLIDLSRVHLVKESWWRVTSDWSGCEKRREPPRGDEQRPRNPKPRPIDALRISRRRCWCGRGRYRGCQGGIDAKLELDQLGLT
jgi:hypothetical protein